MAFATFTLTGTFKKPSGDPHIGNVKVTPSVALRDAGGKVVLAGAVTVDLTDGAFTLTLPAADATLQPQPHGFIVTPRLHGEGLPSVSFPAPPPGSTLDVADLETSPVTVPIGAVAATTTDLALLDTRVATLEDAPPPPPPAIALDTDGVPYLAL